MRFIDNSKYSEDYNAFCRLVYRGFEPEDLDFGFSLFFDSLFANWVNKLYRRYDVEGAIAIIKRAWKKYEPYYSKGIIQRNIDWQEDIDVKVWDHYISPLLTLVETDVDPESRRWYNLSTSVYLVGVKSYSDTYLGVRHIDEMKSESTSVEDCYHTLQFFEMKPVPTVTFVKYVD